MNPLKLTMETDVIYVWYVFLPVTETICETLFSILSPDEQKRAQGYQHIESKHSFIVSRGILRKLLSAYLAQNAGDIEFSYTEYGKPYLEKSPLKFNLSHSGQFVLYGFTKYFEIGVDIEQIKKDLDIDSIAKEICSDNEYKRFLSISENLKNKFFYKIWTIKEAYLKAVGKGLSYPMREIDIDFSSPEKINLVSIGNDFKEAPMWKLKEIILQENHTAMIATKHLYKKIHIRRWEFFI